MLPMPVEEEKMEIDEPGTDYSSEDESSDEESKSSITRSDELCEGLQILLEDGDIRCEKELVQAMKGKIDEYSPEEVQQAVLTDIDYSRNCCNCGHTCTKQGLLLHCALDRDNISTAVIQLLLFCDTSKKSLTTKDGDDWLAFHYACWKSAPIEIMQMLLVEPSLIFEQDENGCLPLHYACADQLSLPVVQFLLEQDESKLSILKKNVKGWLPIHFACYAHSHNSDEPSDVIQLLLKHDPSKTTMFEKTYNGWLPLHAACCSQNASVEVIQLLLNDKSNKKTKNVLEEDNYGRLPIDLAIEQEHPVEIVQCLLRASVADRVQKLGLSSWKANINSHIDHLSVTYPMGSLIERITGVRQIESTLNKYETKEQASLLELALWKASCLNLFPNEVSFASKQGFASMKEITSLARSNPAFDAVAYKNHRLAMSGGNQIIPNVLPFLQEDKWSR